MRLRGVDPGDRLPVQVQVASVMQQVVDGQKQFEAEGATIAQLIDDVERRYPGFRRQIASEDGTFHRFVNIYLNDEDIRYLDGKETVIKDGDEVSILPALAGG